MGSATSTNRDAFEKWISSPPYEHSTKRLSDNPEISAWPGQYAEINVELAWEAWQEAADRVMVRLIRSDPVCENMHHEPHEYHSAKEPCPVMAWVLEGIPNASKRT